MGVKGDALAFARATMLVPIKDRITKIREKIFLLLLLGRDYNLM
jgi:hypothetical protein